MLVLARMFPFIKAPGPTDVKELPAIQNTLLACAPFFRVTVPAIACVIVDAVA
jgi:hypothetical protein